ncbi:MAG: glycine cleavage system aminomethyltransferase GcvT [Vampirovibrionales bacterium]|nr:glycine cleavage system aminomethyltransferase GcvT [Vampirovibrionales bacterium]
MTLPIACDLLKTPLHDAHLRAGAKLVPFAGWAMPLQFSRVMEEHRAVRERAGLFDISHMGLACVRADDWERARLALEPLVPRDLSRLTPGKAVYTQFLNDAGGILDDIIVYRLAEREARFDAAALIICNAANAQADLAWMRRHLPSGVEAALTTEYALLALQGPQFASVLAALGVSAERLPPRFHSAWVEIPGQEAGPLRSPLSVWLSRTGYTGEDGVEIAVAHERAANLWQALLQAGEAIEMLPVGLAARDTLRLEAALPLHGQDITPEDTPLEAGLGWSLSLDKPIAFIGREALRRQQEKGLARNLYCLKLLKKTIARPHDALLKAGEAVGAVTSGSISPTLNEPIAMGYLQAGAVSGPGDAVEAQIRGQRAPAVIVPRPFYRATQQR